jgi:hypothetical protein
MCTMCVSLLPCAALCMLHHDASTYSPLLCITYIQYTYLGTNTVILLLVTNFISYDLMRYIARPSDLTYKHI